LTTTVTNEKNVMRPERKIPGQKVGRHWRFRKEAIDHWLDETQDRHREASKE
jgi:hypothetical protein